MDTTTLTLLPGAAFVLTFSLLVTARYMFRRRVARWLKFWRVTWEQKSPEDKVEIGLFAGVLLLLWDAVLLSPTASVWDAKLYRGSVVRTGTGFNMWYSAYDDGTPQVWKIGRTAITISFVA